VTPETAKSYMQMIYIDSDRNARHTGVGAAMETDAATWAAFNALRPRSCDINDAAFLLDYHDANGDLVDTLAIRREDFAAITGEKALSDAYYRQKDNEYWARAPRGA
jgi:hypothetical protein